MNHMRGILAESLNHLHQTLYGGTLFLGGARKNWIAKRMDSYPQGQGHNKDYFLKNISSRHILCTVEFSATKLFVIVHYHELE